MGFSKYESQRRDIWVEAATLDTQGSLGELPLFSMGPWHFRAGARHRLRIFEPRYREMIRRATAPGGRRCFAAVLQPAEFEVGAKGRVCEIVESGEDLNGDAFVVVEGGAACQILEVAEEEVQEGSPPLFHGSLDELDEEEMESLSDAFMPLAAASEMVDLLSTLGRQLRTMRRRRQLLAMLGHEDPLSGSPEPDLLRSRVLGGDEEGVGAMLGLLVSYRSIIAQMDRLLTEASQTAERLGLGAPAEQPPAEPARPTAELPEAAAPQASLGAHEGGGPQALGQGPAEEAAGDPPTAMLYRRWTHSGRAGLRSQEELRRPLLADERASSPALNAPAPPAAHGRRSPLEGGGRSPQAAQSAPATAPSPASRTSQRSSRMGSAGSAALLTGSSGAVGDFASTQAEAIRRRLLGPERRSLSSLSGDSGGAAPTLADLQLGGGRQVPARRWGAAPPRSPHSQTATPTGSRRSTGGPRQASILLHAASTTLPVTRQRRPSSSQGPTHEP